MYEFTSATGTKIQIVVLGKAKKFRCFRINELPIKYFRREMIGRIQSLCESGSQKFSHRLFAGFF